MPFMLYGVQPTPSGSAFEYVRHLQLAGSRGPLRRFVQENVVSDERPVGWHATEQGILTAAGEPADSQAIVIDLKPSVKGNVSLYRLRDVWGYSYADWSPLALRLESLFVDRVVEDVAAFKRSFVVPPDSSDEIGEFLYVQGGTCGGTWNWGMVGRVNGALLWPNALAYLSGALLAALRSGTTA